MIKNYYSKRQTIHQLQFINHHKEAMALMTLFLHAYRHYNKPPSFSIFTPKRDRIYVAMFATFFIIDSIYHSISVSSFICYNVWLELAKRQR